MSESELSVSESMSHQTSHRPSLQTPGRAQMNNKKKGPSRDSHPRKLKATTGCRQPPTPARNELSVSRQNGMAASQPNAVAAVPVSASAPPPPPPQLEITLLLQQIPDVIFEIASQLPRETALCLALTCKPLHALLFSRTLRRITRRQRHLFLFTLMRDLGDGVGNDHYYCHACSRICIWRCPLEKTHGPCERCPPITLTTEHHDLNARRHACVRRGYFTLTIPELEEYRAHKSVALHMDRTGWRKCCEYSERHAETA